MCAPGVCVCPWCVSVVGSSYDPRFLGHLRNPSSSHGEDIEEDRDGNHDVLSPVEVLYQQVVGPEADFWSAEGALCAIGVAWVATCKDLLLCKRAVVGPVGVAAGCLAALQLRA